MITTIEELSLNAWPSLQTVLYDGWALRFANGYTRRANSINPLYSSTLNVDEKIGFCEDLYRKNGLPTVFKLTPASQPTMLDEKLAASGYQKDAQTSVQIIELESVSLPAYSDAQVAEEVSVEWLESFYRMSAVPEKYRDTMRNMLLNIMPRHCFISLEAHGRVCACGMGVLQSGYVGLFDIVTDPDFRNRGYGQRVVESILSWGRQHGARQAYLQVMLNNPVALRLYSKIGFVEKYQYWYRVK